MTATQISSDIERGLELRSKIKAAQTELKAIEKRLEQAGLEGEQIPLQEEDREGRQFLARSPKLGVVVPVVFESDQIMASFADGTIIHRQVETAAGGEMSRFFAIPGKYERVPKDGQEFRRLARAVLGSAASRFVHVCLSRDKAGIPKSRTIIAWDNVKPLDQVTAS